MTTGRPRDLSKEQFWRRQIHDWQISGSSVQSFCARRGLSQAGFYAWRRELQRRDSERPLFLPVRPLADQVPAGDTAVLEVMLATGRRLRVPSGFDSATLRQLLAVLEEEPPR
jgi:hypothetical protein